MDFPNCLALCFVVPEFFDSVDPQYIHQIQLHIRTPRIHKAFSTKSSFDSDTIFIPLLHLPLLFYVHPCSAGNQCCSSQETGSETSLPHPNLLSHRAPKPTPQLNPLHTNSTRKALPNVFSLPARLVSADDVLPEDPLPLPLPP